MRIFEYQLVAANNHHISYSIVFFFIQNEYLTAEIAIGDAIDYDKDYSVVFYSIRRPTFLKFDECNVECLVE